MTKHSQNASRHTITPHLALAPVFALLLAGTLKILPTLRASMTDDGMSAAILLAGAWMIGIILAFTVFNLYPLRQTA